MITPHIAISIVFILLYLAFLIWYGGKSKPLTQADVEFLLAEIKKRAGKQEAVDEPPIFNSSLV